jgi:hypothetical protein
MGFHQAHRGRRRSDEASQSSDEEDHGWGKAEGFMSTVGVVFKAVVSALNFVSVNDVVGVVGDILLVDVCEPVVGNVVVGVSFIGDGGGSEVLEGWKAKGLMATVGVVFKAIVSALNFVSVNDVVGVVGHVLLVDVCEPVVGNVVVGVSFIGDGGGSEVLEGWEAKGLMATVGVVFK